MPLEQELAEALERRRRRLRLDGVGVPAEAAAVEATMRLLARLLDWRGLERTNVDADADADGVQGEGMSLLLSFEDAALALDVSPKTVARYAKDGRLPTVCLGRSVRIRRDDLVAFVAGLELRSTSPGAETRAEHASLGRETMTVAERARIDGLVAEMSSAAEHRGDVGPVRVVWRRDSQEQALERRFGSRDEAQRFATSLAANPEPGQMVQLDVDDGAGSQPAGVDRLAVLRAELERKRR